MKRCGLLGEKLGHSYSPAIHAELADYEYRLYEVAPEKLGEFLTGVVWSLAWGLVLLVIHDDERIKNWVKIVLTFVICAITFPSDWSCVAAMAILFMGQARGDFRRQMCWLMVWSAVYALVYFFFIDKVYALVQLGTALSIPLLRCYDGTRGKWRSMGKLFYVYYPAHLALIGVLRVLLWGAGASTAAGSF